jgi:hypothetical protein
MKTDSWNIRGFFFWAILLFSAIVRIKGLSTGLPLHSLYDEQESLKVLVRLLQDQTVDPQSPTHPWLFYALVLPFLRLFYALGISLGHFDNLMSVPDASFIFVGRAVSAFLGIASVYLIYRIGRFFSEWVALLAMFILATVPQHIEFSHVLRPEVPAVFFLLLTYEAAFLIYQAPRRSYYWFLGLFAAASASLQISAGLPLLGTVALICSLRRFESRGRWILEGIAAFGGLFALLNLPSILSSTSLLAWFHRVDPLYQAVSEDLGKAGIQKLMEYLIHYNYNLPLILFAICGLTFSIARKWRRGLLFASYPLLYFVWICSTAGGSSAALVPLHPFLAIWAAVTFEELWFMSRRISQALVFKIGYAIILCAVLFWPVYRSGIQSYLATKIDNRSKAELWMSNRVPQGSKIAILEYYQVELDPSYFQLEEFTPRDYIGKKDFQWFVDQGFDYVVLSSGQYVQYFANGNSTRQYRDYYTKFFEDATRKGTLLLDLATHPVLIPDYRIKVFSTRKNDNPPGFIPALTNTEPTTSLHLKTSSSLLPLEPGYYLLEIPAQRSASYSITVKNLKLNDLILQKQQNASLSAADSSDRFPFAIFPIKVNSRISLFSKSQPEIASNQYIEFHWDKIPEGIFLRKIAPAVEMISTEFSPVQKYDLRKPFLLFKKNEDFNLKCVLSNRSRRNISGYLEAFLSTIGEPQPWKDFEVSSDMQEFVLEENQAITIDVPMNTEDLAGDHLLSVWIFTRQDLPFSPQNGAWFNKQIRVEDSRLGIHPVYGIPIP